MPSKNLITSLKELQLQMPRILEQYGSDNELTTLALANPIAALEKTGLTFTDEAREEIETHVRFGKAGAAKYKKLKEDIYKTTGTSFDLRSGSAVAATIAPLVENKTAKSTAKKADAAKGMAATDLQSMLVAEPQFKDKKWVDPLAEIEASHPVIAQVVEWRKMEYQAPRFADEATIKKITAQKSPISNVTFRMSRKAGK